jgi:hypothetical protein
MHDNRGKGCEPHDARRMKMHQNTSEIYITKSACGGSSALHVFTCKQKFLPLVPPLCFGTSFCFSIINFFTATQFCVCVCVCFFLPFFGVDSFSKKQKIKINCRILAFFSKTLDRKSRIFFRKHGHVFLHIE